ncbi:hypothetical protein ABEB36_013170 [Hypothenemus hampei]|uniref:Uncharacterized protein n=1 Tax=Hypothenemus hampei TaxID=57062 RepID=A0ABD1E7D9_HYPHA
MLMTLTFDYIYLIYLGKKGNDPGIECEVFHPKVPLTKLLVFVRRSTILLNKQASFNYDTCGLERDLKITLKNKKNMAKNRHASDKYELTSCERRQQRDSFAIGNRKGEEEGANEEERTTDVRQENYVSFQSELLPDQNNKQDKYNAPNNCSPGESDYDGTMEQDNVETKSTQRVWTYAGYKPGYFPCGPRAIKGAECIVITMLQPLYAYRSAVTEFSSLLFPKSQNKAVHKNLGEVERSRIQSSDGCETAICHRRPEGNITKPADRGHLLTDSRLFFDQTTGRSPIILAAFSPPYVFAPFFLFFMNSPKHNNIYYPSIY